MGRLPPEFSIAKGVRQGDPLAPFLFILAAEGFNQAYKAALDKELISGVQVGRDKVVVSHIQYADDMILFAKWSMKNLRNIGNLVKCFSMASGLKVNMNKSHVFGLGTSHGEADNIAKKLGCKVRSFPFKYLGLPIGVDMSKSANWVEVIQKCEKKLLSWKAKSLSYGGLMTLIKSVLGSLPLYYLSLFRTSNCVITRLEKVRRSFFWGWGEGNKHISWVKWSSVLLSRELGGLNVGR